MKKTVEEINKMIMEDAPMEEINDAIGYIDICSCFDPIFEPPIDFLEECRKGWGAAHSPSLKKKYWMIKTQYESVREEGW